MIIVLAGDIDDYDFWMKSIKPFDREVLNSTFVTDLDQVEVLEANRYAFVGYYFRNPICKYHMRRFKELMETRRIKEYSVFREETYLSGKFRLGYINLEKR